MDISLIFKENEQKAPLLFLIGPVSTLFVRYPTHRDAQKIFSKQRVKSELSSKSSREDMCRLPTSFLLNIQSRVKQEVDMPQIQNCVTRYSSPY